MERRNNGNNRIQLYPNPKEWTLPLGNIPGRKQLDKITVKDITIALEEHQELRCKKMAAKPEDRDTVETN